MLGRAALGLIVASYASPCIDTKWTPRLAQKLTTKLAQISPPKTRASYACPLAAVLYPTGLHAYNREDADADMLAKGAKHTAHLEL
jgi:hypothetical protein